MEKKLCETFIGKNVSIELGYNYFRGKIVSVSDTHLLIRLMNEKIAVVQLSEIKAIREV